MMEWGDIGIKEPEDILAALKAGASAADLHEVYGDRIAGLIAEALDIASAEAGVLRYILADTRKELDRQSKECAIAQQALIDAGMVREVPSE